MSSSAKPGSKSYAAELSLLLALVFCCNSLLIIYDCFFSYEWSSKLALLSITPIYCMIVSFRLLEKSKSFQPLYWEYFMLVAAHLSTGPESSKWNLKKGLLYVLLGMSLLSVYAIFATCSGRVREPIPEQEEPEGKPPLVLAISFLFLGHGFAMLGRECLPKGSMMWMLVGGGVMFVTGAVFFRKYYSSSMIKLMALSSLHED